MFIHEPSYYNFSLYLSMDIVNYVKSNYPIPTIGFEHPISSRIIRLSGVDSASDFTRKSLLNLDLSPFQGVLTDSGNLNSIRSLGPLHNFSENQPEGIHLVISRREHDAHIVDSVASDRDVMAFIDKDSRKYGQLIR